MYKYMDETLADVASTQSFVAARCQGKSCEDEEDRRPDMQWPHLHTIRRWTTWRRQEQQPYRLGTLVWAFHRVSCAQRNTFSLMSSSPRTRAFIYPYHKARRKRKEGHARSSIRGSVDVFSEQESYRKNFIKRPSTPEFPTKYCAISS